MPSITCPHCARIGSLRVAPPPGARVRCPGCGEQFAIPDGSVLPRVVARPPAPETAPKPKPKKKKKARSRKTINDDDGLSNTDVVICLLCPGIGFLAGFLYLITGRGKGLRVLGLAVLGQVVWFLIGFVYGFVTRH